MCHKETLPVPVLVRGIHAEPAAWLWLIPRTEHPRSPHRTISTPKRKNSKANGGPGDFPSEVPPPLVLCAVRPAWNPAASHLAGTRQPLSLRPAPAALKPRRRRLLPIRAGRPWPGRAVPVPAGRPCWSIPRRWVVEPRPYEPAASRVWASVINEEALSISAASAIQHRGHPKLICHSDVLLPIVHEKAPRGPPAPAIEVGGPGCAGDHGVETHSFSLTFVPSALTLASPHALASPLSLTR